MLNAWLKLSGLVVERDEEREARTGQEGEEGSLSLLAARGKDSGREVKS